MIKKISTVIAAYNAENTIAETIDNALAQRYEDHEVVVVDDGSIDSTGAILREYGDRIRVVEQANRGAAAARNAGVANSRGKYVAFLDSDDLWLPDKLAIIVAALERNPAASLAFSEYINFDENGVECGESSLGHAPSMQELMEVCLPPILTSTWVMPRTAFERSGGFSEAFKGGQGFEDSWLLLLLRELGEFEYVPERLTRYRIVGNSESADKYAHALSTFITLVKERYGTRGRALIRNAKNLQCRWMLSKIAHQTDRGDRLGAIRTVARIMRFHPAYFVGSEFTGRLVLPQNMKRFWDIAAKFPHPQARQP
ncbi:MAG: glycosyltransferase family A protein [Candidatus Binataceae bacterium]|jgi:glycosyltransferase involved in cell wall biosynthesis